MIVRKAIQEIRGFRYMAEHLDIRSGLGQKVFYDLPWYGSREEIEGELERVSKTIRAIQEDGRRAEQVAARLGLVKDIRKSVERVKEGVVLDDLELFELKRLALNNGQLQELVKDWGVVCLPDLEGVLEVLDPEGTRIPHFYICDAFSKELAEVRAELKLCKQRGEEKEAELLYWKGMELEDRVRAELLEKGISQDAVNQLQPLLTLSGTNEEKLESLSKLLASSEIGLKGIEELRYVISNTDEVGIDATLELDVSLARGLNYYTGTIIEVKANDVQIGSITGGGRYDNLTGVFGLEGVSGVGISFGADRIFDVLNQLNLYPAEAKNTTKVIFVNFGENEAKASLKHIKALRANGISCELYPENAKMKKQMGYANDNKIPYVAIVGETELANNTITVKCMATGEQQQLTIDEMIEKVK